MIYINFFFVKILMYFNLNVSRETFFEIIMSKVSMYTTGVVWNWVLTG